MNGRLIKAQDVFLEKVNHICSKFGLNNMMAQLYAMLYLSTKPLSLNDMVERLKISKGSASINIRALERYGAVRRVWIRGSRKDYYEAETDISKVILDRVKSMAQGRLAEVDDVIKSSEQILNSIDPLEKDGKEDIELFKQRLEKLRAFHNRAQSLFNLFNSGFLNNALSIATREETKKEVAYVSEKI